MLEAVRPASRGMVCAGYEAVCFGIDGGDPLDVWQAMIHAAINEIDRLKALKGEAI